MDEQKEDVKTTVLEEFSKTSDAAKLSGSAHQTKGFFKKTWGEITQDSDLKNAGRNEQLLGKIHSMVGSARGLKELAIQRAIKTRIDSEKLLKKHGGKLVDQVTEFVEDIKKTFF